MRFPKSIAPEDFNEQQGYSAAAGDLARPVYAGGRKAGRGRRPKQTIKPLYVSIPDYLSECSPMRFILLSIMSLSCVLTPATVADSPFDDCDHHDSVPLRLLATPVIRPTNPTPFVTLVSSYDPLGMMEDDFDGDVAELKMVFMDDVDSDEEDKQADASDENQADSKAKDSDKVEDESEENDDSNGEQKTQINTARLSERMAGLKKPAYELRISPSVKNDAEVPVNQAAKLLDQSPQWIGGGESVPPRADRVHARFCHQPTYYQELNLERCGQLDCECCGCLQNAYSSLWFVGNTALLPYRWASQPHCQCVSGYGDCPSCQRYDCPIEPLSLGKRCDTSMRGVLSQSAAMAGFALLLW